MTGILMTEVEDLEVEFQSLEQTIPQALRFVLPTPERAESFFDRVVEIVKDVEGVIVQAGYRRILFPKGCRMEVIVGTKGSGDD
jgi:hypothetical protein